MKDTDKRQDKRSEPVQRAVVLGESTAWGYSVTDKSKCWANLVVGMLAEFQGHSIELINQAIGSNVLTPKCPNHHRSARPSAMERVDEELIALNPDLVFLSYGLNDSRGGTAVDVFRSEYQRLIDRIRTSLDPLIVVVNTYYMLKYDAPNWDHADRALTEIYNAAILDLAETNDCVHADVFSAEADCDWFIDRDRIHPNDLGHRIIANRIFEAIARSCTFVAANLPTQPNIGPFVLKYRNGPQQPVVSKETVDSNYHLYAGRDEGPCCHT